MRDSLSFARDGVPLVALCLEFVIVSTGPLAPRVAGHRRVFDAFVARFGDRIRLCQGYDDKGMQPYEPDRWRDVAGWLDASGAGTGGSRGAHFQHGESELSAEPPTFDGLHMDRPAGRERSGLRMTVDAGVLDVPGDGVANWFATLLEGLEFDHAFCGLAFSCNFEYSDAERAYRTWAVPKLKRHVGINHGDLALFVLHAEAGMLAINWITAIGRAGVRRLGGSAAIARGLPGDCTIADHGTGAVVVQAGPRPQVGDVNREDTLPLYRAVAQAVRPLWCGEDYREQVNLMVFEPDAGAEWLGRWFR